MPSSQITAARVAVRVCAAGALAAALLLSGCHNLFVCQKASCPSSGSGTGSATGDFVYLSNATSGSSYIAGYDIGSGSLTALTNFPQNLDYIPVAMNVSPNDAFLYVASTPGATSPGIYLYTISSTGQLSIANSGNVLIGAAISSMDISPDGNFLFALDTTGTLLTEYQANTSTGALARVTALQLPGVTCALGGTVISQTCTVKVAPSGDFVVVALGTAGTVIFPYTSSSGISSTSYTQIKPASNTTGDYSVALDSSKRIYVARTDALAVYQINDTAGDATLDSSKTYSSGVTPRSVVLSNSSADVYTANEGDGTISGYSIATDGTLTAVTGSPFTGPANVSALGVDKSGSYMVAAGYSSSSGVQLFSIGTGGALTLAASAGSGASVAYPVVLAMTH